MHKPHAMPAVDETGPSGVHPLLVEAWRGNAIESHHRGSLAVVEADGTTALAIGDVDRPVFPRSAIKLLQALPLVANGAADALQLTNDELAIACASHNGEAMHAATAARMLARAGLEADALECGAHWPYLDTAVRALAARGESPSALHNNCSGKHAGFLCMACGLHGREGLRGFVRGYVAPEHPVMREVTAAIEAATGTSLRDAPRGTDGCSIPTYAIPLRRLALAFARCGSGTGLSPAHARAAVRLREAVAAAPQMVAGTGRFDTRVMAALGARVFCKVGAEAVYCATFPERGLGLALKVDDGTSARAAEVVMAEAIAAVLALDDAQARLVDELARPVMHNWNGIEVGRLQATAALRSALATLR